MTILYRAALAICLCALPAAAQDSWQLDRAHSSLEFAVTHMLISEGTGRFKDFDVKLTTTGEEYVPESIEATIKTGSIDTDNESRDGDLMGEEFFDVAKYPMASFRSTKIEKTGDKRYRITGELTIRDTTRTEVLDATFLGSVTDSRGGKRIGWKAETTINRFDYGVSWNRLLEAGGLVVSKEVRLTIRLEMRKPAPPKG